MTSTEKLTPEQIENALGGFTGTEGYLRHRMFGTKRTILLTDGARFVAEKCGAWWLMDAILSHQKAALKDEMLRDIQFWTLTVKDRKATLTCSRDKDDVAITQEIEFTDFPLPEIKLWLEFGSVDGETEEYILMLPSER